MSDLMQAVPQDAPVMKAWTIYKSSDDFSNTRKWALHEEHVDGSLWVAFFKGYFACAVEAASTIESLQAMIAETREALASTDIGSLPNDFPLAEMARIRMNTLNERTLEGLALIGKIEALQARVRELEEALKQGEVWFREYAEGHSRKGDTDKADRNYNRARFLQKALGASHE